MRLGVILGYGLLNGVTGNLYDRQETLTPPLTPDVGLGTRRRSRFDPKECCPARNVIHVTCKQNISDLLGEHIRHISI
jgi:hypothetical protein